MTLIQIRRNGWGFYTLWYNNRLILSKTTKIVRFIALQKPILLRSLFWLFIHLTGFAFGQGLHYPFKLGVVLNSQTVPLIDTFGTESQLPFRGGGDITIVDDSAIMPESPLSLLAVDDAELEPGKGDISIYVVREGDSLSGIGKMFGVSVNTIVWANDISRATAIQEGQVLVILPISGVRYEVKKGDTLATLAKRYHGDLEEIAKFNDLTLTVRWLSVRKLLSPMASWWQWKAIVKILRFLWIIIFGQLRAGGKAKGFMVIMAWIWRHQLARHYSPRHRARW